MYTLKEVLELLNVGEEDIYCELYRTDRSITNGWLSNMEIKPDTRIAAYALEYYHESEYLILHLA